MSGCHSTRARVQPSCSSFGKLTASTGTLTNPFQYTGREFDADTGAYYYRARYFDQNTGRFISEDPIKFKGGVNFYAGCPILRGFRRVGDPILLPRLRRILRRLTLCEGQSYDPQHVTSRRRLARPDLELPGCLVNKHFAARDDFGAALFG